MRVVRPATRGNSYGNHRERGAAMLEFAIIIPLFVLLMAGIVDLGRGLNQYFVLRRLAYEGGRMASNTERLETGKYSPDVTGGPAATIQSALHGKIRTMIDFHGSKRFPAYVSMITERYVSDPNIVTVTLSTTLKPLLINFFPAIPISASVDAPYLFKE